MGAVFIGIGTVVNMVTVALGAIAGLAFGSRIPERTKELITATLGLITLVLGVTSAMTLSSDALVAVIDELRPHVVVTYDPHGGYGHPDHIRTH